MMDAPDMDAPDMDVPDMGPKLTEQENVAAFEAEFIAGLESEDDFSARELLAAGWPIYYIDDDTPAGLLVKEYPDGRRQLIGGAGRNQKVVRDL